MYRRAERIEPGANGYFDVYAFRQSKFAFNQSCKPDGCRLGVTRGASKTGWTTFSFGSLNADSSSTEPGVQRMSRKGDPALGAPGQQHHALDGFGNVSRVFTRRYRHANLLRACGREAREPMRRGEDDVPRMTLTAGMPCVAMVAAVRLHPAAVGINRIQLRS